MNTITNPASKINLNDCYPSKKTIKQFKLTKQEIREYAFVTLGFLISSNQLNERRQMPFNYDSIQTSLLVKMRIYRREWNIITDLSEKEVVEKAVSLYYSMIHKAKSFLGLKSKAPIGSIELEKIESSIEQDYKRIEEIKSALKKHLEIDYSRKGLDYGYKLGSLSRTISEEVTENNVDDILHKMNLVDILIETATNYKNILDDQLSFLDLKDSLSSREEEIERKKQEITYKRKNCIILKAA